MNDTGKTLLVGLALIGMWIGIQNMHQPKPKVVSSSCDTTTTGGG